MITLTENKEVQTIIPDLEAHLREVITTMAAHKKLAEGPLKYSFAGYTVSIVISKN